MPIFDLDPACWHHERIAMPERRASPQAKRMTWRRAGAEGRGEGFSGRSGEAGLDDYEVSQSSGHRIAAELRRGPASVAVGKGDSDMSDERELGRSPVFDPTPLRDLEQMEAGMAQQILQVFRDDLRSAMEAIVALGDQVDVRNLVGSAHKLKGGSGSIGAVEIQALATELEVAARAGKVDECHRLIAMLREAARVFHERITVDRLASILNHSNPAE